MKLETSTFLRNMLVPEGELGISRVSKHVFFFLLRFMFFFNNNFSLTKAPFWGICFFPLGSLHKIQENHCVTVRPSMPTASAQPPTPGERHGKLDVLANGQPGFCFSGDLILVFFLGFSRVFGVFMFLFFLNRVF